MTIPTGGKVTVPWGLGEVVATVIEAYATGGIPRVRVRVPVLGPEGEELDHLDVTLRATDVRTVVVDLVAQDESLADDSPPPRP